MKDLGFILASWFMTLGSIGVLALVTLRRARELSSRVPDEHKPWV
jgi:hypothetical protein